MPEQISKVSGFADTVPMPDTPAEDEVNRRVTVLIRVKQSVDAASRETANLQP